MKKYYIFVKTRKIALEFKALRVFEGLEQGLAAIQENANCNQQYWIFEVERPDLKDEIIEIDPSKDKVRKYNQVLGLLTGFELIGNIDPSFLENNQDWVKKICFLMGQNENNVFFDRLEKNLPSNFSQLPMQNKWAFLYERRLSKTFMQDPKMSYLFFKVLSGIGNDAAKAQFNASNTMAFFQEKFIEPYYALFGIQTAPTTAEKVIIEKWIKFLNHIYPNFLQAKADVQWNTIFSHSHNDRFQDLAKENIQLTHALLSHIATQSNMIEALNQSLTFKPYLPQKGNQETAADSNPTPDATPINPEFAIPGKNA